MRIIPVSRVEVETRGYLDQQVLTGLKVEPGMYKQPVYYFGYRPHLYYGATGVDTVGKLGYLWGGVCRGGVVWVLTLRWGVYRGGALTLTIRSKDPVNLLVFDNGRRVVVLK